MDPFFRWVETSAFSIWTRESTSVLAYPAFLSAHAIGMGLAVGVAAAMALQRLGAAPGVPPLEWRRFAPVVWGGLAVNAASGLLLLVAYPTKALTNPVFYLKLILIAGGVWLYRAIDRRLALPAGPPRWMAVGSLACWAGAITAGRLLAYTFRRLFVDF